MGSSGINAGTWGRPKDLFTCSDGQVLTFVH